MYIILLQLIKAKDQLLPLLVMDTLGMYPGLPGIFVGGVFSAALRSVLPENVHKNVTTHFTL